MAANGRLKLCEKSKRTPWMPGMFGDQGHYGRQQQVMVGPPRNARSTARMKLASGTQ
jgi:hypothetical protein